MDVQIHADTVSLCVYLSECLTMFRSTPMDDSMCSHLVGSQNKTDWRRRSIDRFINMMCHDYPLRGSTINVSRSGTTGVDFHYTTSIRVCEPASQFYVALCIVQIDDFLDDDDGGDGGGDVSSLWSKCLYSTAGSGGGE